MTNLTEKWKAGELEEGWYYIKYEDNHVGIAFACEGLGRDEYPFVGFEFEDDIEEVLAPVPSYEELQALKDRVNCQKNRIACLEYDLNRCNRLLKQWEEINRNMMQCHGYINHSDFHPTIRETLELTKEMENE